MEYMPTTVCRLCLNAISGGNFKIIEGTIREVIMILLKQNVDEHIKSMICAVCSTRLFAAFHFKSTCTDTQDSLFLHVNSNSETPVDLKEIYLKARDKEHSKDKLEDEKICRLCMQVTLDFTPVQEVESEMIQKCIPEINLNSTKEPVVCAACLDSLYTHSSFLKDCLDVEQEIKKIPSNQDSSLCVKEEDIEIKYEEKDEDDDAALSADNVSDSSLYLNNSWRNSTEVDNNTDRCDYKRSHSLTQHLLVHKDISEVQLFECDTCGFKTKFKYYLKRHQLTHKNISETEVFECDTCDYKTKQKIYIKRHQLSHKNISETEVFECDTCDYKTKYKQCLKRHQLIHKDISEKNMFECDACDFKSRQKGNLKLHLLKHKDFSETQVFECNACDFKTKYKRSHRNHQRLHKDISETQVYECDTCDFKTKYKSYLNSHRLKHKDISELKLFECEMCDYKGERKDYLRRHRLTHKVISKVKVDISM